MKLKRKWYFKIDFKITEISPYKDNYGKSAISYMDDFYLMCMKVVP